MANSKSAEKRIRTNVRNRKKNKYYKTSVRTLIKNFLTEIESYKISKEPIKRDELKETLNSIYGLLDKGTKQNVFHKNTAARQKARLSKQLKLF